jgi:hypothetical protein
LTILINAAAGISIANKPNQGDGINITISPRTLVLDQRTACVTVHSNIPISAVVTESLLLEGIAPVLVKADACGDTVAKFSSVDVKAVVAPGPATLTLTGILVDGTAFAASSTITVK